MHFGKISDDEVDPSYWFQREVSLRHGSRCWASQPSEFRKGQGDQKTGRKSHPKRLVGSLGILKIHGSSFKKPPLFRLVHGTSRGGLFFFFRSNFWSVSDDLGVEVKLVLTLVSAPCIVSLGFLSAQVLGKYVY